MKRCNLSGGQAIEAFPTEANAPYPLVGAIINGELCGLNQTISFDSQIEGVSLNDSKGAVLYRNSLSFVLYQAALQIKELGHFTIGPTMGSSFYCYFAKDVSASHLERIEEQMRLWIEADLPIMLGYISYVEAEERYGDKIEWQEYLSLSNRNRIPTYSLSEELCSPQIFPCVHRCGLLQSFALTKTGEGFLLHFPRRPARAAQAAQAALAEQPLSAPKFLDLYRSYKNWNRNIGVDNIDVLVTRTEQKKGIENLITLSEIHQQKLLSKIADEVAEKKTVRLLLVAGPSSSGKTTFTKRLALHLEILGFRTVVVSLDDFYMPKEFAPKDSEGNPDLECLEALDLERLNRNLSSLLAGEQVEFPRFDFATGRTAAKGHWMALPSNAILLMEGIHGLNPKLIPSVLREQKFHVFISALTQLNILPSQRMPTSDNRLLRRIVRDYQFRSHSAHETLRMWDSVKHGEHSHIFPYQNEADAVFNSALEYEIPILKTYAAPLLKQVKPSQASYARAKYLEKILEFFPSIPANSVPEESILREFIGGSSFDY